MFRGSRIEFENSEATRERHLDTANAARYMSVLRKNPSLAMRWDEMNTKRVLFSALMLAAVICVRILSAQEAQSPVVNIDPDRHGNLAAAQGNIVDAYQRIDMAQRANDGQLGGHAQRAKDFLTQADVELRLAADFANAAASEPPTEGPDNASGNWTIYAQNIDQPGGSTKFVQIQQFGSQLSGHFKGPHQSGGIE